MTDHRLESAANWAVRLEAEDPSTRREFETWRADPLNEAAFRRVEDARRTSVALADHPELLALRHTTIARTVRDAPRRRMYRAWAFAAAACIIGALPIVFISSSNENRPAAIAANNPTYRTDVGQRLAVTLPDGSRLMLNTASQVRLAYTAPERRLILQRGQALFQVAKHQHRPFVVIAGEQQVVAHGTEFDVRIVPGATQVALLEGKVSVATKTQPGKTTAMNVDDVLVATSEGVTMRHATGSAAALASWSDGRVVFSDQTLADAVAEMNRYGTRPMAIVDARAAALRISGSFRTGEIEPFVSALQSSFPVSIRTGPQGQIEISSRH